MKTSVKYFPKTLMEFCHGHHVSKSHAKDSNSQITKKKFELLAPFLGIATNLTGHQLLKIHECHLSTSFLVCIDRLFADANSSSLTILNTIFSNSLVCDKWCVIKLMVF